VDSFLGTTDHEACLIAIAAGRPSAALVGAPQRHTARDEARVEVAAQIAWRMVDLGHGPVRAIRVHLRECVLGIPFTLDASHHASLLPAGLRDRCLAGRPRTLGGRPR